MRLSELLLALVIVATPAVAQDKKATTQISGADRNFVMEAATGGHAEVALGKLAQKQGSSEAVKGFGQRMVTDHSKAGGELEAIASKLGIDAPKDAGKKEATVKKLEALNGAQFDQAYAAQMVADHEATIALFETQAKSGQSSELKAFATKTLPTLREHLKMARGLPKGAK